MSTPNAIRTPRNRIYGRPDQYLDVNNNPTSSGARYLASSPQVTPKVDNWTAEFEAEFDILIANGAARFVLGFQKRSDYLYYLQNPKELPRGGTPSERVIDSRKRSTCYKSYELQEGQVYRKAYTDERSGVTYPARYASTWSDIFENITATHESIMHFGK